MWWMWSHVDTHVTDRLTQSYTTLKSYGTLRLKAGNMAEMDVTNNKAERFSEVILIYVHHFGLYKF